MGHKIIIAAYHILKNKQAYQEPALHNRNKNKQIKRQLEKLQELIGAEIKVDFLLSSLQMASRP